MTFCSNQKAQVQYRNCQSQKTFAKPLDKARAFLPFQMTCPFLTVLQNASYTQDKSTFLKTKH